MCDASVQNVWPWWRDHVGDNGSSSYPEARTPRLERDAKDRCCCLPHTRLTMGCSVVGCIPFVQPSDGKQDSEGLRLLLGPWRWWSRLIVVEPRSFRCFEMVRRQRCASLRISAPMKANPTETCVSAAVAAVAVIVHGFCRVTPRRGRRTLFVLPPPIRWH